MLFDNLCSMLTGEQEAWKNLADLDPEKVVECTDAEYWEEEDVFVVLIFGKPYLVNVNEHEIREIGPEYHFHYDHATHFGLLVPLYLSSCAAAPPSGKLVSPKSLPHGAAFFKGPHEIPEEVLAHHFGSNPNNLIAAGEKLGGTRTAGGDTAIVIPSFPLLPVTVILWVGDLEFPARAQMLLDETTADRFGLDAIWAALVFTAEALIQVAGPHH